MKDGRMRRRYEEQCPQALERVEAMEEAGPQPGYVHDDGRFSGMADCDVCGHCYFDHPPHPFEPSLTVTCDGLIAKL